MIVLSMEGLVAAGKSTLLQALNKNPYIHIELEELDVWCNWHNENLLQNAYAGTSVDVLRLQLCASATRSKTMSVQRTRDVSDQSICIMERCSESGLECFGKCNYETGRMTKSDYELQRAVVSAMPSEYVRPDAILYIECTPAEAMQRLAKRSRTEETSVSLSYMTCLEKAHRTWIAQLEADGIPVLRIDGTAAPAVIERDVNTRLPALIDRIRTRRATHAAAAAALKAANRIHASETSCHFQGTS